MSLRITFLAISTLLFSRLGVLAQVDAQDRTQAFFDNNKGADVTNPTRALTDRIRQPQGLTHQSTLPPLTGVPDAAEVFKSGRRARKSVAICVNSKPQSFPSRSKPLKRHRGVARKCKCLLRLVRATLVKLKRNN